MRLNISILAASAIAMFATVGCKKDQNTLDRDLNAGTLAVLHIPTDALGHIVPNAPGNVLNLTSTDTWLLDSVTRVPAGYTLNIPAGTVIQTGTARTYTVVNPLDPSDIQTRSIAGVLVVERGGTLNANGTATAPVVFTSGGSTTPGSFGGVIILGNAPTNKPTTQEIEGLPDSPAAGGNQYGGTNSSDNSGSLTYVRIEYPGIRLFDNQEINGLTLGGVGSNTTLEHIQVMWSADDSFEFFGGTVNAKYLLANSGDDDDFDFDFGYSGNIQFAVGLKDPNSTHSTSGGVSDANGIESDNDGSGSAASPVTLPKLSNFTLLGYDFNAADLRNGNRWRRATSFIIKNSIIAGFPNGAAFDVVTNSGASVSDFSSNIVHGFNSATTVATTPAIFTPNNTYIDPAPADKIGLGTSPFYGTFGFSPIELEPTTPVSGADARTGASFTNLPAFFTSTSYRGAVDPTSNWVDAGVVNGWIVL